MKHRLALAGALAIFSTAALAPEAQAQDYGHGLITVWGTPCFLGSMEFAMGWCLGDDFVSNTDLPDADAIVSESVSDAIFPTDDVSNIDTLDDVVDSVLTSLDSVSTNDVSNIDTLDDVVDSLLTSPEPVTVYAQVQSTPTQEVPEPLTMMGSAVALGFGGMFHKKRKAKKSA